MLTPRYSSFPPSKTLDNDDEDETPTTFTSLSRKPSFPAVLSFDNDNKRTTRRALKVLRTTPHARQIKLEVARDAFIRAVNRVSKFVTNFDVLLTDDMYDDLEVIQTMLNGVSRAISPMPREYGALQRSFERLVAVTGDTGLLKTISDGVYVALDDAADEGAVRTAEVLTRIKMDLVDFRAEIKEASSEPMSETTTPVYFGECVDCRLTNVRLTHVDSNRPTDRFCESCSLNFI
jgi:hypothetical protein